MLKNFLKNYGLILLGAFSVASAYVFFITPYKIIPGGVYGISIVIHYLTEGMFSRFPDGLPIGMVALCFNIPLVFAAYKLLGSGSLPRTITTFVATAIFVDLLTWFYGREQLVVGDPLLASIYGGVLIGIGVALIFRAKGTSAGTDVIARIMAKYSRIPIGFSIITVDSVVVLIGLIAFGDWAIPLYSWITIFVYGKVVDIFQSGLSTDRAVFVISEKNKEIGDTVTENLKRGGTYFYGKTMYKNEEREILYTVVNSRQIPKLREIIHDIDPAAFITILPANEILGKGFQALNEKIAE
ncbi:MAG: YitT family protein [Bacteroidales bacterium]|nr:YitT family protein [Bacteroidales bacterium]